jgi:Zn-dependent M28 family amino/carboxypeptidase
MRLPFAVAVLLFPLLMMDLLGCTMPGQSFTGPLPALTDAQKTLADELKADVTHLAKTIGHRDTDHPENLAKAADYIEQQLAKAGLKVTRHPYDVAGQTCVNLDAEIRGKDKPGEIVLVGAHYDSVRGAPGANDNASGVAAVLALARRMAKGPPPARTIRFAAFVNEEPPYFQTERMGSLVYAKACKAKGENIVAMLTPETIGCYSDEPGSQYYPAAFSSFYPSTGNFIAFVGNVGSAALVKRIVGKFRNDVRFPSEGAALVGSIEGVGWSDHWSFWQCGYPGVMVTDTAPFRYRHYHTMEDTPDKIDYERTARVVEGLGIVVGDLVNGE